MATKQVELCAVYPTLRDAEREATLLRAQGRSTAIFPPQGGKAGYRLYVTTDAVDSTDMT